ncbi:hypothetical protein N9878_01050 [bacterium]|nr:hypothetical protein [bacterium]
MQDIINKILSGELSQKQLIQELVEHNEQTATEYDEAVTVVENNQLEINKLEATARKREDNIKTIEKNALVAVDYARSLESKNIILQQGNKELKALKADNKKLKAQTKRQAEANKKAISRAESLTNDCKEYRKDIAQNKSDIARLRLTGAKAVGNVTFHIFPSKVSGGDNNEKRIALMAHDNKGAMKCVTVEDGEVVQAKSTNFRFSKEQEAFITGFDSVAKEDDYKFTDRVLSLVN